MRDLLGACLCRKKRKIRRIRSSIVTPERLEKRDESIGGFERFAQVVCNDITERFGGSDGIV